MVSIANVFLLLIGCGYYDIEQYAGYVNLNLNGKILDTQGQPLTGEALLCTTATWAVQSEDNIVANEAVEDCRKISVLNDGSFGSFSSLEFVMETQRVYETGLDTIKKGSLKSLEFVIHTEDSFYRPTLISGSFEEDAANSYSGTYDLTFNISLKNTTELWPSTGY